MVTKLELYNAALGYLGPVRLANLNENRPDRRELDAVYDGALQTILEQGLWFFALRTVRLTPDADVEPMFGRSYVFSVPTDFVRLRLISTDERQEVEDTTFRREGNYWHSDHSILYVTYVSNHTSYGLDLGKWPEAVADAAAAEMAEKSTLPISKDKGTKNDLAFIKKRALVDAKRLNAVDERVKGKPLSSWASNRLAGNRGWDQRRERT